MKEKLKKGKITMIIIAGIVWFILALVMSMQFKIVNETDITSIESMRETELRTELANWKEKYEEVNAKYEETTSMINEYKETDKSNNETEEVINNELEQINMSLGKTDVQGSGIEVILTDTNNEEIPKINKSDRSHVVL